MDLRARLFEGRPLAAMPVTEMPLAATSSRPRLRDQEVTVPADD
jgi:hypothetical protein